MGPRCPPPSFLAVFVRPLAATPDHCYPNGGAVVIGHPSGSLSTRYVLTLATELPDRGARYGVAGVCIGSRQAVTPVLENPQAG